MLGIRCAKAHQEWGLDEKRELQRRKRDRRRPASGIQPAGNRELREQHRYCGGGRSHERCDLGKGFCNQKVVCTWYGVLTAAIGLCRWGALAFEAAPHRIWSAYIGEAIEWVGQ